MGRGWWRGRRPAWRPWRQSWTSSNDNIEQPPGRRGTALRTNGRARIRSSPEPTAGPAGADGSADHDRPVQEAQVDDPCRQTWRDAVKFDFSDIDSGASAWVLVSAALVLLMTPGIAFFYGGMVRSKH